MYPVLLSAPLKDYLWGGNLLKEKYNFTSNYEKIAESWVLACHKDGESVVLNGELSGKKISEVLHIWGKEALGENASRFEYFPILIKLIDAKQKLSLQVHPNDEYALKNEGEYGKTEMWYIVEAEPDAKLIYGFNRKIDKSEFEKRIRDNTITDVCNFVPVQKGDVFFIESGTLHAIGEGILIAEIQQNSNTTYRVSDYGRLGADGKPRQLHIDKAIDVTVTDLPHISYGKPNITKNINGQEATVLSECDYFKTYLLNISEKIIIGDDSSFVSLLVLDGEITVKYNEYEFTAIKGNSVFIPANIFATVTGSAQVILSKV